MTKQKQTKIIKEEYKLNCFEIVKIIELGVLILVGALGWANLR